MTKGKIDKATAIKSILKELKKGTDKKSILEKFRNNWNFSTASFYNWYAEAETQFKEFRSKVEPIEIQKTAELEAEAGILTKAQALKILSDLAMTAERDSDKINAAKTMADFQGWKAPTKTDITSGGEPIKRTIVKWGDNEIEI